MGTRSENLLSVYFKVNVSRIASLLMIILIGLIFFDGNMTYAQAMSKRPPAPSSYDSKAVGEIWGTGPCLGTLISPDLVVTAAHCVCSGGDKTDCLERAEFTLIGDDRSISGDVHVHPSFQCKIEKHCSDIADIAVIKLDRPVIEETDIAPIAVEHPNHPPLTGDEITLIGIHNFGGKKCRKTAELTEIELPVHSIDSINMKFKENGISTCEGDSGGPAINENGHMVGVAMGSNLKDQSSYLPVHLYYDWLSTYMAVALFNEHSNKCMDVSRWSQEDGANVQQWNCQGDANKLWTFDFVNPNEFMIVSLNSGKCLTVEASGGLENGTNVVQMRCSQNYRYPYANQLWEKESVGDGYFKIVSTLSGKSLTVDGRSKDRGENIYQEDYRGLTNQHWKEVVPRMLVAKHSDKCVDVSGWSQQDGANVHQWECHGGANQLWAFEYVGTNDFDEYMIISLNSGQCLESGWSQEDGVNVRQGECHGDANQLWTKAHVGDGSFRIASVNSRKYLEVNDRNQKNGANVRQSNYDRTADRQQFFLESPLDTSVYLQTLDGLYLRANNGGGTFVQTSYSPHAFAMFTPLDINRGRLVHADKVQFKTFDRQHYLCAIDGGGGELTANRTIPSRWESFTLFQHLVWGDHPHQIIHGDKISIRTYLPHYAFFLTTKNGQIVSADSHAIGPKETFKLLKASRVRLNSYE